MNPNYALKEYEQTEKDYVVGIESPHGRILLVYGVILENIDRLIEKHPKTDFISFGKAINGLNILANSLDMEKGAELSDQLLELYDYCSRLLKQYLEDKKISKLEEAKEILSKLEEGWISIKPK